MSNTVSRGQLQTKVINQQEIPVFPGVRGTLRKNIRVGGKNLKKEHPLLFNHLIWTLKLKLPDLK